VNLALEIVIILSSSGCIRTSRTVLLNSGSSSRKRTPLCESDISPGCGNVPPPTRATSVIVSNEGVFYNMFMQIIINKDWSSIEVIN
jgi:hypothetical protein